MQVEQTDCGLKSELARLCLPAAGRDSDRKFAWMNSICLLFLAIGLFGRPAAIRIQPLPPPQEIIPAVIEPVVLPQPATVQKLKPEQLEEQEAGQIVVTQDSPDIHFSVPTIGNLIAPAALSAAPPLLPMKPRSQSRTLSLENTGSGGERPQPPYPKLALEHGQQGTVVLLLKVDETGAITTIELKSSSGFPVLDRSTLDFVKRRWIVPPDVGTRIFEVTINYRLETN